MSHDLLLGTTSRSWNRSTCGAVQFTSEARRQGAEDVLAQLQAPPLAKEVEADFQRNFQQIVKLRKALPVAERKDFGKLMRRWQDFKSSRQGKFSGVDYVELSNFRDAVRKVSARLSGLALAPAVAQDSSPAKSPATGAADPQAPLGKLLGHIALGILGVVGSSYLLSPTHRKEA